MTAAREARCEDREALRSWPARFKGSVIVVDAADGRVTLRGELMPDSIDEIERLVRKVVGVREVDNFVHPPGTPAPNKEAALNATTN